MRLRGIRVEHWRCIAKLELADLPDGITVLHAPNRSGKTSLVGAIRACLFDFDHTATGEKLRKNIPRRTKAAPAIEIELEHRGVRYRVKKVFATGKQGLSELHQWTGGVWKLVEEAPKEVTRRTRELLGMEKSTAGLNQLLWLAQGEVELPEASELDDTVQQRLMNVLGVLITGRDLEFRKALEKRSACWFTPGGEQKKTSPLTQLEATLGTLRIECAIQEAKFGAIEETIRQLSICEEGLPTLRSKRADAEQERDRLKSESLECTARRQQHHKATIESQLAESQLSDAEGRLGSLKDARRRHAQNLRAVRKAERGLANLEASQRGLSAVVDNWNQAIQDARAAEQEQLEGKDELEARRTLLSLSDRRNQQEPILERCVKLATDLAALEQEMGKTSAPEKTKVTQLRKNREEAGELRAQLAAGALQVSITTLQTHEGKLHLDDQDASPVALQPGVTQTWSARQRAEVELAKWGAVQITRATASVDLDAAARELGNLERSFQSAVRTFGEDPNQEDCLDRLHERRDLRDDQTKQIALWRQELKEKAPAGQVVLEESLGEIDRARDELLALWLDLKTWVPDAAELERNRASYEAEAQRLKKAQEKLESDSKLDAGKLKTAESTLQESRVSLAAFRATAAGSHAELDRLASRSSVCGAVKEARKNRDDAQERLKNAKLTPEEETVETRLVDAETAVRNRQDRLRNSEDELLRLRTQLQGSEGLHLRRADAEAAVHECERALSLERLEADAHRLLEQLFEECRENQVKQVMAPISARLLEWCNLLGLADYEAVRFGDTFFPEGLVLQNAPSQDAVPLSDESYGMNEQLSLLIRLALGGLLANEESAVCILDDPLAHADPHKHRRMLDILRLAASGNQALDPPAGRLQMLVLTCHPDRFDYLQGANIIDLSQRIQREP